MDGSLEAFEWRRDHPESEWEPRWAYEANEEEGTGSNGAHYAAHAGDLEVLTHIIENPQHRKDMIHEHDNNGWLPIHEVREMKLYKFCLHFMLIFRISMLVLMFFHRCLQAARAGHKEIVEILVKHGVNINERTDYGEGQSVLNLALEHHEEDSEFIFMLKLLGALDLGSEDEF